MIRSKKDLQYYLQADAIALQVEGKNPLFTINNIWLFQRLMRKCEYLLNTQKATGFWGRLRFGFFYYRFRKLSYLLGFSIPLNVFGPGLAIAHRGTIVINGNTRIGANCRIHVCVNIGASGGLEKAPQIGNNVYIAPGAKIFGNIQIADGITIGANAVVNKSFTKSNITIGGIPARKIFGIGSEGLVIPATEILKRREQSPSS